MFSIKFSLSSNIDDLSTQEKYNKSHCSPPFLAREASCCILVTLNKKKHHRHGNCKPHYEIASDGELFL
jgi:hypothetical protein